MPETVLFDRYRLLEPAGRGGSAEVWRALDLATGEEVAVKRLHPIVFADEAGRRRLEREFDTLRTLDEPHIVRVRDLRFGDREAALVLDFVAGESLAQRLARHAADGTGMTPDAAIAVVDDVAAALAAAHAAGIVHRDVTPGNILLTPDGEARLTDFGIAHASGDDPEAAVTATGLVMGTMRYLAPEQLRGQRSTPASDLHGLAAVAYEMLAGRPAFDATSPVALAEAQEAGPAPIDGVPPALDAAVRRGLERDPDRRPADVLAYAAGLSRALADEATVATPIMAADRTTAIPLAAAVAPLAATGQSAAVDADPAGIEVGVASPSRAASAHGPFAAVAVAEDPSTRAGSGPARAAPSGRRRRGGLPAPVAIALGLLIAVGLLAAATSLDRAGSAPTGPSADGTRPPAAATARPTTRPSLAPSATPKPDKGKGNGKGHGKGKGD